MPSEKQIESTFPEMDSEQIFYGVIASFILKNVIEVYLKQRQINVLKKAAHVPNLLEAQISEQEFHSARCYLLDTMRFDMFQIVFGNIIMMPLELCLGLAAFAWTMAEKVADQFVLSKSEPLLSGLFVVLVSIFYLAKELPFAVYQTYVVERRPGKNKKLGVFVIEMMKQFSFNIVGVSTVTGLAVVLLRSLGEDLAFWLWILAALGVLLWHTVLPTLCAELYERFKPMKFVKLTAGIKEMASSLKAPLDGIYVFTETNWFAHNFALYYGVKRKYIVLHQRLLPLKSGINYELSEEEQRKRITNAEARAVLAHELGHWKLRHNFQNLIVKQLYLGVFFGLFYSFQQNVDYYHLLGFDNKTRPIIIELFTTYFYTMSLVNAAIHFGVHGWYRRLERKADEFVFKQGLSKELASALVKLSARDYFALHDWLYSAWYFSTPTLLERLQYLEALPKLIKPAVKTD